MLPDADWWLFGSTERVRSVGGSVEAKIVAIKLIKLKLKTLYN